MNWTESEIKTLIENYEIKGPTILSKELNRNPRAIGNKAKKLGLKFNSSSFYESEEFDKVVMISKNLVDVCRNLNLKLTGGNRNTIKKWIMFKKLNTSHFFIERNPPLSKKYTIEEICVDKSTYIHTTNLKNKLYKEGIKNKECELCGQNEIWKGKKISLILDHINGDKFDNRLENLRIVCPNCNATLDTNGGKNIKNKLKQTTLKERNNF